MEQGHTEARAETGVPVLYLGVYLEFLESVVFQEEAEAGLVEQGPMAETRRMAAILPPLEMAITQQIQA
jgi:hypothetical protein